jgi:hypothetical protein
MLGGKSKRGFGTIVTGSEKRYNAAFGVVLINATASTLTLAFRNTSGALIDSYTLSSAARAQTQRQVNKEHVRVCC